MKILRHKPQKVEKYGGFAHTYKIGCFTGENCIFVKKISLGENDTLFSSASLRSKCDDFWKMLRAKYLIWPTNLAWQDSARQKNSRGHLTPSAVKNLKGQQKRTGERRRRRFLGIESRQDAKATQSCITFTATRGNVRSHVRATPTLQ